MQIKPSIIGAQRHVNARSTQGEMANAVAQHVLRTQMAQAPARGALSNHSTLVDLQNELSQQPRPEPGV